MYIRHVVEICYAERTVGQQREALAAIHAGHGGVGCAVSASTMYAQSTDTGGREGCGRVRGAGDAIEKRGG